MRILTAHFTSGEDFLGDHVRAAPGVSSGSTLLVRTRSAPAVREPVLVEICLPHLPNRERLVGHVVGPGPGGRGVWVELSADDRDTLAYLEAHARRFQGAAVARAHARFPLALSCDWRVSGGAVRVMSTTEDLSAGGAFVRALSPPGEGTTVIVELPSKAPAEPIRLSGEVVWVRRDTQASRSGGMGIRFAAAGGQADGSRRLREMLRHAAERGRVQTL